MDDPVKEIPFQGVYKVDASGNVKLLTDSISRPNGIAFMPGEKTLLVANSDSTKPVWYRYKVDASGNVKLLTDSISRPNGIAFMPGEKTLLVANSDSTKPVWYMFDVD